MRKFLFSMFSMLIALVVVAAAYAQDTQDTKKDKSDEDTYTLQTITVTAQKRESNLQKTPISIQAVTGTQLAKEGKQRLDEIMEGIVGVSSQGSQVGTDFYMRGLGTANFGPPTGGLDQSAVAVLIDGVYQNRGEVVRGGTLDMKRVEVMRGTQSTTLGASSLAGAVSLVSNNPVFKYQGSGSLEIGNYHLMDLQGVLNVPLADNQAVRIAYSHDKRDGYISAGAGNSDLTNARVKYRWQATDALNMVATFNHQDIGGNGVDNGILTYYGYWEPYDATKDGSVPLTLAGDYDGYMGDPAIFGHVNNGVKYDDRDNPWDDGYPANKWPNNPFRDTKIDQYSAHIDWDLGIGTLSMEPSYQKAHFVSQEQPRGWNYRSEDRLQKTKQLDMQLASPASSSFKWLGGVYYYNTDFSGSILTTAMNYTACSGPPGSTSSTDYSYCWSNNANEQTEYAAYGNLTYPILDRLRVDAGVRYTRDKKTVLGSDTMDGNDAGPFSDYTYSNDAQEATWNDVTYRIGTEYDVTSQAMAYVIYATGYQPGTFANNAATGAQTLKQWTAGLKSRWLDSALQLNIEGFHSTYYNRNFDGSMNYYTSNWASSGLTACGSGNGPTAIPYSFNNDQGYACYTAGQGITVPTMTSEGVDLELNWLITEKDRFDASAEYLHSVEGAPDVPATESALETAGMSTDLATEVYNGLAAIAASYDGLTMQNSPKWSFNASYSHIFDLPNGSTLTPRINGIYKSSYWSLGGGPGANIVDPGDSVQDAYTLWNAYLTWTSSDDQFSVSAYVKNIDDKPILTNVTTGDPSAPVEYVALAPPRTFGVILSANF